MSRKILNIILIVFVPFAILFMFGTWQLFRLNWKNNIITKMDMPPINLTQTENISELAYRKVLVHGILSNLELYVFAGGKGYYALTPMLIDRGEYVLVNKGIISKEQKEVDIKNTTINGMLYCDANKNISRFIKNKSEENTWLWLDIREISKQTTIKFNPCIVWAGDKSELPKPRNDHLQYVITWYALAFAWLVVCCFKNTNK